MRFVWEHLNFPALPVKQYLGKYLADEKSDLLAKINRMLDSDPVAPASKATSMWKQLNSLNATIFDQFWEVASPEAPKCDYSIVEYVKTKDREGKRIFGMKNSETNKLHGIVRIIEPYTAIFESTYKNGKNHGLSRAIYDNQVIITLYKEGNELAKFSFDKDFMEIQRQDPHRFLTDYDPLSFRS
jgi:hypothetical protein